MPYLGRRGASAPLTSADIPDSSITTAKIVDGTVAEGDLAFSTATQAELDAQRTNSSITTLGTVTSGDISHADIVYPAGHVIKTATDYWEPSAHWVPGTATASPLSISFTPISSSSKLHLFAYFGMVHQTTTPTTRTLFNFHKGGTLLSPGGSSWYGALYLGENTSGTNYYQDASVFLVISSYSGAATIDVRISGDSTRKIHSSSNNWLTIQEVAQ